MIQKHLVFIFARAPYDSATAKEGLDALLAGSIFDQRLSVIFIGDGVFQLTQNQSPTAQKNHSRMLQALSLYDIQDCYAHDPSLKERALTLSELCLPATLVTDEAMQTLLASADHILSF